MAQLKKPTIKNPELVAAMAEFKQQQTKEREQAMLDAIKEASFIAPITLRTPLDDVEPNENGERQLQASLMAVSNPSGQKFFPAFTDWLEFLKWKNDPEAETMVITFSQYCDLLFKQGADLSGIVINPAETNILLQREKMAELAGVSPEAAAPKAASAGNQPQKINRDITPLFGAETITNSAVIMAAGRLKAEQNAEAQNALFDAMRATRFVAPVKMDLPENVKAGDKVTAQAEFIMLNHGEEKYMPLFTSLPELQKWIAAPPCKAVPVSMANYTAMLSDPKSTAAGIVIDPFTMGLSFPKAQAIAIQPQLVLQDLKTVPLDLVQELKEHYAQMSTVEKAYFTGVKANGADAYLVVLDLNQSETDPKKIADETAQVAKRFGKPCVVAPINSPLGKKAIEGKAPFYQA